MAISEKESVAGLKLLVAIAKADGSLSAEERRALEDELKDAKLPGGLTPKTLLDGDYDVDALAGEITSPDARDVALSSAFAMAYADHHCLPQEQAVLDKLEKAWMVPKEKKKWYTPGRMFSEAHDIVSFTRIQPIADPKKREAEITEDVRKYAILAAALGINPVPIAKLATELAVVALQGKMIRDIGQYWGRETTKEGLQQLLAGMGVGQAGRVALNTLLGFVPIAGSVIPAAVNFTSTWACGRVANQFYASGGKLDRATLRDMFKTERKKAKEAYEKNKAAVEAKAKQNKATLDQINAEYKAGKINQAEYDRRVYELK